MRRNPMPPAPGELGRGETVLSLIWLPFHMLLLPIALLLLFPGLSELEVNFFFYVISSLVLLIIDRRALRRDFDPLCDEPLRVLMSIVTAYGLMLLGNFAVGLIFLLLPEGENPNNAALESLLGEGFGMLSAAVVFLAPIAEELLFRGALFGSIRKKSRVAAYAVSALIFGAYHVWAYALSDPSALWYLLQYLPAGLLLAWCYERSGSIWGSIFLHMLNNGLSMLLLKLGGELL